MKTLRTVFGLIVFALAAPALDGDAGRLEAQTPLHNCSFCHSLHGGSLGTLADFAVVEDLCNSCHGPEGPAEYPRDGVNVLIPKLGRNAEPDSLYFALHNGSKHTAPTSCWDCHNHEGEAEGVGYTNLKMIQATMPLAVTSTSIVIDTAWTGLNSFADGDATIDGVCEVCHTLTDFHKDGGPTGAHNFSQDCTTCHKHYSGFEGRGGGCAGCHSSAQGGRRVIVSEFDRTTHHVDWAGGGLASSGDIPDSDCETCHDQSTHQAGNVRLWDVDDPGNTEASVVLTGDPNTSSTEAAKLSTHCLSCHDADGANGNTTPFTGGATVAAIDATAWAASSHEGSAAIVGCYGDGAFGCHSSGHGSEKKTMLAPPETAATSTWLTEDEEGFCLACHDSDGPAGTDLKTAFNRSINWVQQATGLNANPNLNDRHDVQADAQAQSGARIECTSCHNPHTATSAQPYILDPDPGDGHVPGTDYYYYSATSDVLSEFCLDCHDGSWPAGVTDSLPGIVNIETTWALDGMGASDRTGNVGLEPSSGWTSNVIMECWRCHSPHPVIDSNGNITNHFAISDTTKSPTGTPLDGYFEKQGNQWLKTFEYNVSSNASGADPVTDAGTYCMTCHDRTSMVTKDDCYSCHRHGDVSRW